MRSGPTSPEGELVTLEEFRRMPEEDAYRVELPHGRVVREPRPGAEHGWLAARLVGLLTSHVEEHALGVVVTETGFLLREHPSTVRGPALGDPGRVRGRLRAAGRDQGALGPREPVPYEPEHRARNRGAGRADLERTTFGGCRVAAKLEA